MAAHSHELAELTYYSVDLLGKLACWGEDECLAAVDACVNELKHADSECSSQAQARLLHSLSACFSSLTQASTAAKHSSSPQHASLPSKSTE
mmetsp:Transcript_17393/g.31401  ORF Transcript_17393/g.31401 Transcript_17393/m.31401 type:complete len:92 (-) Transcript_17393:892-1167(-)